MDECLLYLTYSRMTGFVHLVRRLRYVYYVLHRETPLLV